MNIEEMEIDDIISFIEKKFPLDISVKTTANTFYRKRYNELWSELEKVTSKYHNHIVSNMLISNTKFTNKYLNDVSKWKLIKTQLNEEKISSTELEEQIKIVIPDWDLPF